MNDENKIMKSSLAWKRKLLGLKPSWMDRAGCAVPSAGLYPGAGVREVQDVPGRGGSTASFSLVGLGELHSADGDGR